MYGIMYGIMHGIMHRGGTVRLAALAMLLLAVAAGVGSTARGQEPGPRPPATQPAGFTEFKFQNDDALGALVTLTVWAATRPDAEAVQRGVLDEMDRLRRILSPAEPTSEITRLNESPDPIRCSYDLLTVLSTGEEWRKRTGGAFSIAQGDLVMLWKFAEKKNKLPDEPLLKQLLERLAGPACKVDTDAGTAQRLTRATLNLDSLARGFIIDKCLAAGVAAGKACTPPANGIMLAIGEDVGLAGSPSDKPLVPGLPIPRWRVSVPDPARGEGNGQPLADLLLFNRAVASRGHYDRYYKIGDKKYSRILDPRTGQPTQAVLGGTAVARDATTAAALADSLCVLDPIESLSLVHSAPDGECLIVNADGRRVYSPGFKSLEAPTKAAVQPVKSRPKWPAKYLLDITLTVKIQKRSELAVWIEDNSSSKPVRTIEAWADDRERLKELTVWWGFAGRNQELVQSVTRASRKAGRYSLVWDGKDDAGTYLPQDSYKVCIELVRDKGPHIRDMTAKVECKGAPAVASIPDNSELEDIQITYGPLQGK